MALLLYKFQLCGNLLPNMEVKRWFVWVMVAAGTLSLGLFAWRYVRNRTATSEVTTYEECVVLKDSVVGLSYPGVCVTRDGQRFTQILTEEEQGFIDEELGSEDW